MSDDDICIPCCAYIRESGVERSFVGPNVGVWFANGFSTLVIFADALAHSIQGQQHSGWSNTIFLHNVINILYSPTMEKKIHIRLAIIIKLYKWCALLLTI